ncbi:MAG: ABC transporter ATP-binding protein [Chloroflexota bacterium]
MTQITIEQLKVQYFGRNSPILNGVDLTFHSGETVLLLGASGSGKSTLALTLNGLIPHSLPAKMAGTVNIDELDTKSGATADLSQKVGIVFQDPEAQFVTLKVEDEILFGLENLQRPVETMSAKVDHALMRVGLPDYRMRGVDQLSGGQKQRIALASLLAMEPSVLIFDEPTANLDPVGTADVFGLLSDIKSQSQHTIILIEHKLDSLMHLIDRVMVLGAAGIILADGTPTEIFYDQAAMLQEHGIWMPEICQLASDFQNANVLDSSNRPLMIAEMASLLKQIDLPLSQSTHNDTKPNHAAKPIIEVQNVAFSYDEIPVLKDVSVSITTGEFLAIVGGNGAGKTTLAQQIVGILQPSAGELTVNGKSAAKISGRNLVKQIGYIFQNPENQFVTNSVFDEVAYGLRVAGLDDAAVTEKTDQLLAQFGITRHKEVSPFMLSHGEKRRLSVATMLAMGQEILILDEPTFGQDQKNAVAIMQLLTDLNQAGKTIIMITHDMHLVAEYASRVVCMSQGSVIFDGAPTALFLEPTILQKAMLTPPPVAQMAQMLADHDERWRTIFTRSQAMRLVIGETISDG